MKAFIPIEKKICVNITAEEIALTVNAYLHKSQKGLYETINFTIITEYGWKEKQSFNLIIIACKTALSKKQVADAVNDVLKTMV